jgi:hypothetical protein
LPVKQSLYQLLELRPDAPAESIAAAYEARKAKLAGAVSSEDLNARALLRGAFETLSDPARRKQYDEQLREERRRALSSGMEAERPRPANALAELPESGGLSRLLAGGAALLVACAIGGWAYVENSRKVAAEARRVEAERAAEQAKRREAEAQKNEELANLARQRSEADKQAAEYRLRQIEIDRSRQQYAIEQQRQAYQKTAEERTKQNELRNAEMQRQRAEQENVRNQQMQLERERRYLQELERNHPRRF